MTEYKVAVLEGDGIGPEIIAEAMKILTIVEQHSGVKFNCQKLPFGASAYFSEGKAFPDQTIAACDQADAILKGPIGLSFEESKKIPVEEQPERGALLPMRRRYDTYANLRPISLPKSMAHFSPLRDEVVGEGIDIMLVRELVGGLYFGAKERGLTSDNKRYVKETLEYDEDQIRRILEMAFKEAEKRKGVLHNIHKNNVLISSVLWNEILDEVAQGYPDVTVINMLVDAAATHLCLNPGQFDVMVMENMFGDILSDQGGGILGSLGLMPSACIGEKVSYYEPSHGSAPDIAGKNMANPYSMIGSVALMLEMSFAMTSEADALWQAMQGVFAEGYTTADLARGADADKVISTVAFGDRVAAKLRLLLPAA